MSYAQDIFEECDQDFTKAKKRVARGCYERMLIGSAEILPSLETLVDTAVELVRLADDHAAKVKTDECATEFKARYGELFAR